MEQENTSSLSVVPQNACLFEVRYPDSDGSMNRSRHRSWVIGAAARRVGRRKTLPGPLRGRHRDYQWNQRLVGDEQNTKVHVRDFEVVYQGVPAHKVPGTEATGPVYQSVVILHTIR